MFVASVADSGRIVTVAGGGSKMDASWISYCQISIVTGGNRVECSLESKIVVRSFAGETMIFQAGQKEY